MFKELITAETKKQLSTEADRELMGRVHHFVVEKKSFKDAGLTMNSLCEALKVNRSYLSKAVNCATGKNFTVWINEHRVNEALTLLKRPESTQQSIDGIAYEAGFNNRTTFYRTFKKFTGISPTDYRKQTLNEKDEC